MLSTKPRRPACLDGPSVLRARPATGSPLARSAAGGQPAGTDLSLMEAQGTVLRCASNLCATIVCASCMSSFCPGQLSLLPFRVDAQKISLTGAESPVKPSPVQFGHSPVQRSAEIIMGSQYIYCHPPPIARLYTVRFAVRLLAGLLSLIEQADSFLTPQLSQCSSGGTPTCSNSTG